jgi:CheY-like chemotaxis protein
MKIIKLFWIDDMETWAATARTNLGIIATKYGIDLHIIPAVNGEEVVQQLMMYDFDAVIMDYQMEPFNGDKYIKDIRNEEHLELVPILFYSQNNSIDLQALVSNIKYITTIYRPNLEDRIKEMFLLPK